MNRQSARRGRTQIVLEAIVLIAAAFGLWVVFGLTGAGAGLAAPLCGEGSAPDYGFSYDLVQAHWTVDWEAHASEEAVNGVDVILDQLNADSIAQTMILIKPQEEVGNRVNCAVHFLRYMKLGLPTGERKDNGFVFLIVVEPERIDVHYGVGLGLPALTAAELTSLNRSAEAVYQSSHSIDQALLTLVEGYDRVARNNYTALVAPTDIPEAFYVPPESAALPGFFTICGQLCMGIFLLLILMVMGSRMGRRGSGLGRPGGGIGFPFGGGGGSRGIGGGFGGGGRSSPPSRGGSGSGRSGRGN